MRIAGKKPIDSMRLVVEAVPGIRRVSSQSAAAPVADGGLRIRQQAEAIAEWLREIAIIHPREAGGFYFRKQDFLLPGLITLLGKIERPAADRIASSFVIK